MNTAIFGLQIGDEGAGNRKRRAHDTPDDQGAQHAGVARQSDLHQHERRENERHQSHSGNGIRSNDRDRVRRNRGKEK